MNISARVINRHAHHEILLKTGEREHSFQIAPKPDGFGSSANGGELLFLALATCYCNDIYREARKRGMEIQTVEVEVTGEFGGEGEPARSISYRSVVEAYATREEVLDLMRHTDSVAEIQNTLRQSTAVLLTDCDVREA
jgi:uncharacterized OsmC-like protein